jgi:hypothetical protein
MSHREFQDEDGRAWEVWDVHPANFESFETARDADADARGVRPNQLTLPNELRDGWLAFKCGTESRRLAPIPTRWVAFDDQELALLVRVAKPIGPVTPRSSV